MTITWLKATENNNDRDEAEAITFGGEPVKTALPIPFTKELSSCQMMRVTGLHFAFFPLLYRVVSAFESLLITIFELLQISVFTGGDGSDSLLCTLGMSDLV